MTIRPPTLKTRYLLVTCCMEESRREILNQVITQLMTRRCIDGILPFLTVIDNGSTDDTVKMLRDTLGVPTYSMTENLGYWSAIRWYLDNVDTRSAEFIHIIESDHFYYGNMRKLGVAEKFLLSHPDVGAVRLQEYSVKERHLYDKTQGHAEGRKYAWVSHVNSVTGEPIVIEASDDPEIYVSNFLTVLHGLNRLPTMREVFDELGFDRPFSEPDFQRLYHARYPRIALLDGGIFHAKLGFTPYNPRALSGSWSRDVTSIGYRTTRQDTILQYPEGTVVNAWDLDRAGG